MRKRTLQFTNQTLHSISWILWVLLGVCLNLALLQAQVGADHLRVSMYTPNTYTHYEFTSGEGKFDRITDEQWKQKVKANDLPPQPEWTEDFFVPWVLRLPPWTTAENEFPF